MNEKIEFRQFIRERLTKLDDHTFNEYSLELSLNLLRFFSRESVIQEMKKKKSIGGFSPIDKEPIWYKAFQDTSNLVLSFPSIDSETKTMLYRSSSLSELVPLNDFGSKKIMGPQMTKPKVVPDLILIPGMAFSKKGERLGRGKGFFDRYLESYQGLKVGIGFEMQLFTAIPTEEHDCLCDMLITEKNIYSFK